MKVKFLQDFQGRETSNRFYLKGDEAEFETDIAVSLIQNKFAEDATAKLEIQTEPEVAEVEAADPKPAKRGKK